MNPDRKFNHGKETKRIDREFDSHFLDWLRAISRNPQIADLPDTEEEIKKWMDEHPEETEQLEKNLTRITEEYALDISSIKKQE